VLLEIVQVAIIGIMDSEGYSDALSKRKTLPAFRRGL
jgi:hypothetical protein